MKEIIKEAEKLQRQYKRDRKTSYKGKRNLSAYDAQYQHFLNRNKLRHLNYAYAILRGKPLPELTKHQAKIHFSKRRVEDIVNKYKKEFLKETLQ